MLTSREPAVAIVADDLTGAGDSTAPFADLGWHATVRLDDAFPAPGQEPRDRTVTGVVTDSRAHDADTARLLTRGAAATARAAGFDHLFVKIDSTARGSLGGQVAGALEAWETVHPDALALVCPAYPAMGRSVVDGRVRVNGVAVEGSPASRDPRTPVATGDLAVLLPGSRRLSSGSGDAGALARAIADTTASGGRLLVADASSDHDLDVIAAAVTQLGPRVVAVGSAGLSAALARAWSAGRATAHPRAVVEPTRRVLVVVSSLHVTARRQCDRLAAAPPGRTVRLLEPRDVAGPPLADEQVRRWLADTTADVLVVVTPTAPDPSREPRTSDGDAALTALAHAAHLAFAGTTPPEALVLVGGDGARTVLRRLGCTAIAVVGTLREGVPVGRIVGGQGDGVILTTKAGGFGSEGLLTEVVDALLSGHLEGATP